MLYNGKYIHLFYLRFKAYLLSNLFLIVCFFLVSIYTNAFANYFVQDSISCLDLQIEVLQEPFCQGSVNGGQLKVNVTSGSGSYSYEWLNDNGGFIPGGPQSNATTLSFLTVNQIYWAYVTDNITNCYDSISYVFTDFSCQEDSAYIEVQDQFNLNPVGYNQYSECNVQLINLGCQLNFKPEFIISHETDPIEQGDFIIEYYNAQSNWESIAYNIDAFGNAIGYWGSQNGEVANCDYFQVRPVRVKFNQFNPTAPIGDYIATLRLWSVDNNGNLISIVSENAFVSLTLIDTICEDLSFSNNVSDASCSFANDGQIILAGINGDPPYQYSLSNSPFSYDSTFTSLTYGTYLAAVKDANGCQNLDTIIIGPDPVLPDSLWFNEITPSSANIYWNIDSLVDGYKFRYRILGQAWQGPVASGLYSDSIAEMFSFKTLSNLNPASNYEVQVKVNSLTGCEEGWSSESYFFTTPIEHYNYSIINTCNGINSGQIEFELFSENNYSFNWQGPDNFNSSDTSIYNLYDGNYNLQVNFGQNIIFDTTFVISVSNNDIGVSLNGDPSLISYSEQDGVYFVQVCDLNSYVVADSGYFNYSWNYGTSLDYLQSQQILIDTSNIFLQVEALDTNNCVLTSDSIFISLVSDYVNFTTYNSNEEYIEDVYVLCSSDTFINIDISEFISGNYSVEWRQVVGVNSILLSENPSINIYPTQNTAYTLNISSCSFDFYVNFYPSPALNVEHTNLLCNGDTNAVIYISTDSSSIINYTLIDSSSNIIYFNSSNIPMDTIENLSAGFYTVELKDEFLCAVSEEIEILQPDSIYFDSVYVNNINCFEQGFGSILFSINSNVDPDIFILNDDTINLIQNNGYYFIENLIQNSYNLNIIDVNGCFHSLDFEINESPELLFSISSYLDTISCYGDSTSFISLNVSGGTPNYFFQLFDSNGLYSQQILNQFDSLPANNYVVYVIDSLGCQDSLEIIIYQNPMLQISEDLNQHQDILCNGDSSGFISLTVEGGNFFTQNTSFNQTYNNLVSGYYSFSFTDSLLCTASIDSIQITEPSEISLSLSSLQNINCFSPLGNVEIEVLGGALPYNYSIYSIDNNQLISEDQIVILNNLSADTYSFYLSDANNCIDSLEFNILDQTTFNLNILNISDTLLCYGDSSGFVEVDVGLSGNLIYSLFTEDEIIISNQQSPFFENIVAGNYIITAEDSLGCIDTLLFSIIGNSQLLLNENLQLHQDILCNGSDLGVISPIIEGGLPPYSVGILDDQLFSYPHQFNNLNVDQYSFIAFDTNGCISDTLNSEIISNPLSPELVYVSSNNVDCQNLGSAIFQLLGGIEPLIFKLNGEIIAINLDSQNQFELSDLESNFYQLTIEDSLCVDTVNFEILDNTELIFEILEINDTLACYTDSSGFVEVGVQNGAPPYLFNLVSQGDTIAAQNNYIFNDLAIGDYSLYLTDAEGCNQEIFFNILADEIIIQDSLYMHQDVSCYGADDGEFMLNIESIYPTIFVRLVDTLNNFNPWFNHPHLFNNLSGGIYTIEIASSLTDDCPYFYDLEILEPDTFILDSILVANVLCNGDSSGALNAYISGGTPNYTYLYNNDDNILSQQLYAGSFNLQIIDSNGCTVDTSFIVFEPNVLDISIIDSLTFDISCFGNNDGQIALDVSGGLPPYQFDILGQSYQNTNIISGLLADTYLIEVTDSLGCYDTITVTLTQPDLNLFIDSYELSDTLGFCSLCYGDTTGFIDIFITGGTPNYSYFMLNETDTFSSSYIDNLVGGKDYKFFVIDSMGCFSDTITIECTSPDELILEIESSSLPTCCYSCDVELILSGSGGVTPYSYGFENNAFQSESSFYELCGDSLYTFKILDDYGCQYDSSYIVLNKPCLVVDTINYINANLPALISNDICKEDGTAVIYVSALEGEGDYSFSIDFGSFISQNEIIFDSLFQGIHYIVVKDELNCLDTLSFVVDEPDPIVISDLTIDTIFCGAPSINSGSNESDIGAINAIAGGGSSGVYFYSLDQIDSTLYQNFGLFENLDSGYYSMNIIDLNDCIKEFDLYIPFYSLDFDFDVNNISCPGFNDGIINIDTVISEFNTWITLNENILDNNISQQLDEGIYTISANYFIPNSSNICSYSEAVEIFDKDPLDFSYDLSNPTCYGACNGLISISQLNGGTSPYDLVCINLGDTNLIFDNLCADEYAIKMIDANGCLIIEEIDLLEPNVIYPIIDLNNSQLFVVEPTLANPTFGIPPYFYQWYDSNGLIVGAVDSIFEPSFIGEYYVEVTDKFNCIGESSSYNIEVLEMLNLEIKEFDVFPNPFNNFLNVSSGTNENIYWEVIDLRGKLLKYGNDYFIWKINTSELSNGIYYLKLMKNKKEFIYKIVKQ
tara:strand:- start:1642 stop:8748 length:7107 start_codon:yes stop_codon:yes gene_type:complete